MDNPNRFSTDEWVDRQLAPGPIDATWIPNTARALNRFRQRRDASRKQRRRVAWIGAAAAASLTAFSFPATRVYAQRCAQACAAETNRVAQFVFAKVVPGSTVRPAKSVERQIAPDFALTDADGRTVQLSALRGRVVLLNFWATWCKPCRIEIPWFVEFQREFGDRGLSVVGISLDEDGWSPIRDYIAERKINYPVMLGGEAIVRLYGGLESLPTTFVIDRSGRIAAAHIGLVSRPTYEAEIRTALNEP